VRPAAVLCALLATLAALSLAWSVKPPPEGGLTVVFGDEPRTLDPAQATLILEGRILSALLEGLTVADGATLEPRPGAAESWDISADGLTYTFHLRDAAWSDGRPVTAEDFRWSWLRVMAMPEAANWELMKPVKGAQAYREKQTSAEAVGLRAPDARTLLVELERPTPYFLALTSLMTYLPVPRPAVEAHGRHWTRPGHFTGNGPFTLSEWSPNHRLIATRNPRFRAPAALPAITFLCVAPGPAQFNLYEGGMARWVADPPPDLVRDLAGRPDLHVSPRLGISFVRMAANHEPFKDNRVRRAFSLTIDRPRIVKTNGAGQLAWEGFVPPGLAGYAGAKPPPGGAEAARDLLRRAGRVIPKIRFLYPAQKEFTVIAQTLQAIWKETLGIEVVLDRVDRKEWSRRRRELDYELCLSSWIGDYQDPNSFLEIFTGESGNNQTGWSDPVYDALVKRAAGERGEARLATLAQAEERLLAEGPAAPLYVPVTIELWDPKLRGISENLLGVHPLGGVGWGQ
jgi:oligopeptide transport system substrate-binding protein